MRKILLATALLGSLMVPLAGTADAAKVIIAPGIGGWVGPGPYGGGYVGPGYGGGYVGPGYGGGYIAPGFGIGWVGPGYYYNPGYYDRYYHPRYGYCRSTWYRGVRVCRWQKRRWW
jgi:hypothetical protein